LAVTCLAVVCVVSKTVQPFSLMSEEAGSRRGVARNLTCATPLALFVDLDVFSKCPALRGASEPRGVAAWSMKMKQRAVGSPALGKQRGRPGAAQARSGTVPTWRICQSAFGEAGRYGVSGHASNGRPIVAPPRVHTPQRCTCNRARCCMRSRVEHARARNVSRWCCACSVLGVRGW
jgi:hypothetical protein